MIIAKNITHFYGNDLALDNMSLKIQKSQFVALTGQSGSGKSTLLSVLSTLLIPTSGEIIIDNQNVSEIKDIDNFRRENIGFVFQFHYLIDYLTLFENIQLAVDSNKNKKIEEISQRLGIENILKKYPYEISGGQRQRVAIARAVVSNPKIIFADEPTGNLDSKNSQNVFEYFKELANNGTTIITATHDISLAKSCDRIIEVCDGRV
jgi:putative ABC transport system ATP-binding protein